MAKSVKNRSPQMFNQSFSTYSCCNSKIFTTFVADFKLHKM